jgi:DNA-binding MarR family transcriptional regulator
VEAFDRDLLFPPKVLPYRMKLLVQALTRYFQSRLDPFGLTPFQWGVLTCLWREDGLPTLSIGERLSQLAGTLTGVLDTMESRGLIRRERDAHDRRVWRVWLTPEGKDLEHRLVPLVQEMFSRLFEDFTTEEYQQISAFVDRLLARISRAE